MVSHDTNSYLLYKVPTLIRISPEDHHALAINPTQISWHNIPQEPIIHASVIHISVGCGRNCPEHAQIETTKTGSNQWSAQNPISYPEAPFLTNWFNFCTLLFVLGDASYMHNARSDAEAIKSTGPIAVSNTHDGDLNRLSATSSF